jgi:hypothetical protein
MNTIPFDETRRKREPRIRLLAFDQIQLDPQRRYLVKGLIPRVGITVIWGAPKSGKSFWTFDVAMHIALGWNYRDRRVHQGPLVYCAFEGAVGFRARVEAFRKRFLPDDAEPVPFYLVPVTLDLVGDHKELIAAIKAADAPPAAVVLDTLNRSLRGSESSDQDMTAYVHAADAIREAFDCGVLIVHHSGLEASRPRGHTSLTGACDAQLSVKRDGGDNIIVTVEHMKDGPEGDTVASRLEVLEVGLDEDGEQITSCVVVPAEITAQGPRGARLTANQQSMINILDDAGRDGLSTEEWNDKAREHGIGANRRATLMDLRKALKDKGLIHGYADRWYVTP